MIIEKIWLMNWSSFYGEQCIDLSIDSKSGANVILFHGETGSGKTSITSGIQWAVSGITKMTKKVGDVRTSIIRKPIMWKERNHKGSLMNLEAFEEGVAEFGVRIEFTHEKQTFRISRTCKPTNGAWSPDDDDSDDDFSFEKAGTGQSWQDDDAQKKLNEIIPKRLLQFFVVEGDFIEKYTETLFGTSTSIEMNQSVKDAVGIEALHRATIALNTISTQTSELIKNINIKSNREEGKNETYNYLVKRLKEVNDEIEEKELKLAHKNLDFTKSKQKLETFEGVRQTLEKKERIEAAIIAKRDSIPDKVERNSANMAEAWKAILTPVFKEITSKSDELKSSRGNLMLERARKTVDLDNIKNQDEKTIPTCTICGSECETCRNSEEPLDSEDISNKIKIITERIEELNSEINLLEQKIEDFNAMDKNSLSDRNRDRLLKDFDALVLTLNDIDSLGFKLEELNDLLVDVSDEDFKKALRRHDKLEAEIDELTHEINWLKNDDDNDESVKALERKLKQYHSIEIVSSKLKAEKKKAESRKIICGALYSAFEKTEKQFLNAKRMQLDESMTSTFKLMITDEEQKQTHDSLKTEDDWSVSCLTKAGGPQPMTNPGTQRKATLSYLEALRNCSGIEFPITLDNPAAPLELPAKIALAEHFIGDAKSQTILLTHSGGWELGPLLEKFPYAIARAYHLHGTRKGEMFRTSLTIKGGALIE